LMEDGHQLAHSTTNTLEENYNIMNFIAWWHWPTFLPTGSLAGAFEDRILSLLKRMLVRITFHGYG
jgi:hypothetical protein